MAACLLDSNILLYLANPTAPEHPGTMEAVTRMLASGDRLEVAAQCIFEFWCVATRPVEANGLGWPVERAAAEVRTLLNRFPVASERSEVLGIWLDIVVQHKVKGKRVHDAHLLATMRANAVPALLTLNGDDFPRVAGVTIVTPVL